MELDLRNEFEQGTNKTRPDILINEDYLKKRHEEGLKQAEEYIKFATSIGVAPDEKFIDMLLGDESSK